MKFLCVRCDEAMKLEQVERPEDGSLGVVFACAACGNRVAMLTNPWETQLVRALDVRIGGRSSPAEPMEFLRSMLASGRDTPSPGAVGSGAAPPSACPFSAVANLAAQRPGTDSTPGSPVPRQPGNPAIAQPGAPHPGGPGYPEAEEPGTTTGPVAESPISQLVWSSEAERRLERLPELIRPMVRQGIERFAATRGYRAITETVMDEARGAFGM